MAKFKHGFPVSTAEMVGFLSLHNKSDRPELIRLATAMVLSEELKQDIDRMGQWVNAVRSSRYTTLPFLVDNAPTVWAWRLEGMQIIREAVNSVYEEIGWQAQREAIGEAANSYVYETLGKKLGHKPSGTRGKERQAAFAFQATLVAKAFESKLKKEQKLAEEVIRKGLFT